MCADNRCCARCAQKTGETMARSAKQIAATKRLVKLNKARAAGKSSKPRKGSASAPHAGLSARVKRLEGTVSKHATRLGKVEKVTSGMASYLSDQIAQGVLGPVRSR